MYPAYRNPRASLLRSLLQTSLGCSHVSSPVLPTAALSRTHYTSAPSLSPSSSPSSPSPLLEDATSHRRDETTRVSSLGIQMLSKPLHEQIFGEEQTIPQADWERSWKHLQTHGLWGKAGSTLPDVDVQLPTLVGRDIDEHFRAIAEEQLQPYLPLAKSLSSCSLPQMPRKWQFEAGWTRYTKEAGSSKLVATRVDCPDDEALILDVEVCVTESQRPILATAVSDKCWYSWVSRRLVSSEDFCGDIEQKTVLDDLIPLETREGETDPIYGSWLQRLVVGHNVSYDRARVKEQYLMKVRNYSVTFSLCYPLPPSLPPSRGRRRDSWTPSASTPV